MKKRMFITTIVMMLVLAVALTTSSLAWFSSANTTVSSNEVTFKASTTGNNTLNLKISRTTDTWINDLQLSGETGESKSMQALIPTAALVSNSTKGDNYVATGYKYTGASVNTPVTYQGYVWPSSMAFNGAKIGDEGFIIDDGQNAVTGSTSTRRSATGGYYHDSFFIHNSGQSAENAIGSLTFTVESTLTAGEGDTPCNAYAAFILFDKVELTSGNVPDNAVTIDQGTGTIVYGIGGKTISSTNPVADENTEVYGDATHPVTVWIPFTAFTIAVDNSGTYTEQAWQYANFRDKDNGNKYSYNGVYPDTLKTQMYDGISGTGENKGFTLNTANMRTLNNKIAYQGNYQANAAVVDNYCRSTSSNEANGDKDTTSVFRMDATETYLVSMYFWLDGYTMNNYSDTTVATLKINIAAGAVS